MGDEQGGFRKGRGCVDQIFAVKILVEKYLEKDRKSHNREGATTYRRENQ